MDGNTNDLLRLKTERSITTRFFPSQVSLTEVFLDAIEDSRSESLKLLRELEKKFKDNFGVIGKQLSLEELSLLNKIGALMSVRIFRAEIVRDQSKAIRETKCTNCGESISGSDINIRKFICPDCNSELEIKTGGKLYCNSCKKSQESWIIGSLRVLCFNCPTFYTIDDKRYPEFLRLFNMLYNQTITITIYY